MDLKALDRVLVPVDLSLEAAPALRTARSSLREGGELHVVYVLPELHPLDPAVSADLTPAVRIDRAGATLRLALDRAGFGDAECVVTLGDAAHEIDRVAQDLGAQLIVMMSHHYRGFRHFLLGSVAERVMRGAPCPVLVLRPEAAA